MNDKTLSYQNGLAMTKNLMSQKMGDKSLAQRNLKSQRNAKKHGEQADSRTRIQSERAH